MDFLFKLGIVAAKLMIKHPDKVASVASTIGSATSSTLNATSDLIKENRENSRKKKIQENREKEEMLSLENMLKEIISKHDLSKPAEFKKALQELETRKIDQISRISNAFEIKISRADCPPAIENGVTKVKYEITVITDPTGLEEVDDPNFISQLISENFGDTENLKFSGRQIEFHFPISRADVVPIKSELNSFSEKLNQIGSTKVKELEKLAIARLNSRFSSAASAISQLHNSLAA